MSNSNTLTSNFEVEVSIHTWNCELGSMTLPGLAPTPGRISGPSEPPPAPAPGRRSPGWGGPGKVAGLPD
eukprot:3357221-Pyramimonas_sp.AAC.1